MTEPVHHVPDAMLGAYAADALAYPFAVLVAAHVSLCDECRARLESHHVLGGLILSDLAPVSVSPDTRRRTLAAIDVAQPTIAPASAGGTYPTPIAELLGHRGPRWQALGFGARQAILWNGQAGTLRLLSIPAGQAVPEHGHRGIELTLVLSGAFTDASGVFRKGDLEVSDEQVTHTPTAAAGEPCICAAATDAPLRFRSFFPRLMQPILRI
jgi:putative transcriptional regulator